MSKHQEIPTNATTSHSGDETIIIFEQCTHHLYKLREWKKRCERM